MRVKKAKALSNPVEAGEGAGADRPKLLEAYRESHMGYLINGLLEVWDSFGKIFIVQKIGLCAKKNTKRVDFLKFSPVRIVYGSINGKVQFFVLYTIFT